MKTVKESQFFYPLFNHYTNSPSVALCRIPELELLSQIQLEHPILDHCCGDGYIAAMAFPKTIMDAGVDLSQKQLDTATQRGNYTRLECADAGIALPFKDGKFATVINNSGIEHILNLDKSISEIARVLKVGGKVYLNVLNNRYFDRWPLSPETANSYRNFQPFYHALNEREWRDVLERHKFKDVTFTDYFPESTSKVLAGLDYRYSAHYFRKRISPLIILERFLPASWLVGRWRTKFGNLPWQAAPGTGSGFLISATKAEV
ncbi:MAG: class I SAM-dependent methyltransferase [Coleofasciculus sp. G3-WIS-01]|uniref:class I SAM-dependent methyltransferase n=1 Tax=Coleofasciculus sp. G3-WIS-01 TaxID=3069528 RepID=UPI0032FFC327